MSLRQSQPPLVPGSTDTPHVRFEPSASSLVVCMDHSSVAGLIDVVAGSDPMRLPILFRMIRETSFTMEMRAVLRAAVACRDPLSDLGTICTDALRTLADLEKLGRAKAWGRLVSVVGHQDPRACALLNACDHEIERLTGPKLARLKAIRSQLEAAAQHERRVRGKEMEVIAGLRQARCPKIWELYEGWRDTE